MIDVRLLTVGVAVADRHALIYISYYYLYKSYMNIRISTVGDAAWNQQFISTGHSRIIVRECPYINSRRRCDETANARCQARAEPRRRRPAPAPPRPWAGAPSAPARGGARVPALLAGPETVHCRCGRHPTRRPLSRPRVAHGAVAAPSRGRAVAQTVTVTAFTERGIRCDGPGDQARAGPSQIPLG